MSLLSPENKALRHVSLPKVSGRVELRALVPSTPPWSPLLQRDLSGGRKRLIAAV